MDDVAKPKPPVGLNARSRRLWNSVVEKYELRVDELRVLEDACREATLIDAMVAGMKGEGLVVTGSRGQPVVNPLVSELRQHRSTLAALMRQLKLPEDGDAEREAGERSSKARAAANARWATRGA